LLGTTPSDHRSPTKLRPHNGISTKNGGTAKHFDKVYPVAHQSPACRRFQGANRRKAMLCEAARRQSADAPDPGREGRAISTDLRSMKRRDEFGSNAHDDSDYRKGDAASNQTVFDRCCRRLLLECF